MSGNIKTICADLFDLDEAIKAVKSIDDNIDFLVNNAAYLAHTPNVLDLTEEEINKYAHFIRIQACQAHQ